MEILREYKQEKYHTVNYELREEFILHEAEAIDQMDELMAESAIEEDCVLYRGTDFRSLDIYEDEDWTGETISDLAYMSTSRDRNVAEKFAARGLLLEIHVPAGTRGVEPEEILFSNEKEVVLDRELEMIVIEDNLNEDNRILKVEVV